MSYIKELQDVIRRLHGAEATHVETVPIKEEFQGQTIWQGEVEVFDLHNHPQTHRVYAWAHETEDADPSAKACNRAAHSASHKPAQGRTGVNRERLPGAKRQCRRVRKWEGRNSQRATPKARLFLCV